MIEDLSGRVVAVHYNFKAGKLSVREIHPVTGRLTRLVGLFNNVALSDACFTCDERKWAKWVSGNNPKSRQFAEIRGVVSGFDTIPSVQGERVFFDPRHRPDFYTQSNDVITHAPYVFVSGRQIYISKKEFV